MSTGTAPQISIDKSGEKPIYVQIYESVRAGILAGAWRPGDKLPSIRALAARLDVARNTVDSAYRQLVVEGYAESRQGSGYIVENISRGMLAELSRKNGMAARSRIPRERERPAPRPCKYDFSYGDLCEGVFPIDAWRRIANEVLAEENARALVSYNDSHGERALREQIARHVSGTRGVSCTPEQVIVTNGTQHSLAQILGMFDPAADRIAMDDPGYDGAHVVVRNAGFEVDGLRCDGRAGSYLHDVQQSTARLFYTTPSHQFPMGWCMDQSTRSQLLVQAVRNDAFILEDDYDSGYRYTTRTVPSLQSLDRWGRVAYLGTFSKILSPALRMSYMVLPPALLARYEATYRGARSTCSWIDQMVIARFMEGGQWQKHIRRTALAYRKRCELVMRTLKETFGTRVKASGGDAGLFVLLDVDNGMDQAALVEAAAKRGVRIADTRHLWLDPDRAPKGLVMLGFSAIGDDGIREGIAQLERAWFPEG